MKSGRNQLEGIKEVSAPSVGKLQTTTINTPSRFPRRERCKFGQTDMRSRLDTPGHTPAALMNHSAAGELPQLGFFWDTSDARNVNSSFGDFKRFSVKHSHFLERTTAAERLKSTSVTADQTNLHFRENTDYYRCLNCIRKHYHFRFIVFLGVTAAFNSVGYSRES